MKEREEKDKDSLRITNQFRGRNGMVYDMRGHGRHLTVVVGPRTSERDLGEWRAEGRAGGSEGEPLEQWGETRIEAVQALGQAWTDRVSSGLPPVDWQAVVQLLQAVRAV